MRTALLALAGCSLSMDTLPDNYDRRSAPSCDDSAATAVLDDIAGAVLILGAIGASEQEGGEKAALGFGVLGLAFGISSITGYSNARSCRRAKEEFQVTLSQQRRSEPKPEVKLTTFYCTSSPTSTTYGYCRRSAEKCAATQATLVTEAGDATPCETANVVECFDLVSITDDARIESCHPTVGACNRRRDFMLSTTSDYKIGECEDRR